MVEHISILNWCIQVVLLQMHVDCTFLSILSWCSNLNFSLFSVSVDNAGLHKRNLWCLNKG